MTAAQVVTLLRLAEGGGATSAATRDRPPDQLRHGLRLAEISGRRLFWVVGVLSPADVELATARRLGLI